MRADRVVVAPPALDDDLGLAQCVEDLAVEQLIAQARIETLDEAILPRAARCDVRRLCPDRADPFLHGLGNELGAIIGTNVPGYAAQDKQIREHVDDIDRLEPARYPDSQAFMGELVDDVEQAELAPVMGALLDKIVRPDMVGAFRPQPDARSVSQPQAAALGLLGRDLQPLASPDPLDPLVVDQPAGPAQKLGDLAIAVAAILLGQRDDVGGQSPFVVTAPRDLALRRAVLTKRRTGPTLRDRQHTANMLDAGAATRGA